MNPYVGHQNPLKEGQELFRKGLLSEAMLALEAEVMKNPENAEGWRLLGITHAENDDDQQAIAAMMRAQEADPTNLEVLLALGVSHTNELEQTAALKYLYGWLRHHPKYGTLAPPELANSLYYADALDLKPNYVRAWANMGISYANLTLPRHQHLPASYLRSKFCITECQKKNTERRYTRFSLPFLVYVIF
ncbi:peroxisome biogenesis protein 5-like [Gossypium hirsutum]|uniref:Peroxisome biogenesis protein 5-like n=1 Tax=Gossypium hirsutum TaxID=3635 RepID=A0ABM2ZC84_GOSHI|nr:peroxisome biogenesis protein 5-like [Gossypium hirsutum]